MEITRAGQAGETMMKTGNLIARVIVAGRVGAGGSKVEPAGGSA
jgi:hypothetical protein